MADTRWRFPTAIAVMLVAVWASPARAIPLNEEGTINLNVRAYVNARFGTMSKQSTRPGNQPPECVAAPSANTCNFGGTYPYSGAGNMIQNRYFLEAKWNHDLLDWWSGVLPASVTAFKYNLTYRGEYEGIYDIGPSAYRNNTESRQEIEQALRQGGYSTDSSTFLLQRQRHRLRSVASYRNRLFQAFVDWEQGPVFVRFGRQNLVWGETDVFRLLDNINPTDSSFGGFFIDLDERRVPLNMLRVSYNIGTIGPLDQAFVEAYAAMDNTVAGIPGAPTGSPWATPLGPPTGSTLSVLEAPGPGGFGGRGAGGRQGADHAAPRIDGEGAVGDFAFDVAAGADGQLAGYGQRAAKRAEDLGGFGLGGAGERAVGADDEMAGGQAAFEPAVDLRRTADAGAGVLDGGFHSDQKLDCVAGCHSIILWGTGIAIKARVGAWLSPVSRPHRQRAPGAIVHGRFRRSGLHRSP